MLNILIAIVPIALFVGMAYVMKTRAQPVADVADDSIEVFRGPSETASVAIDSLAEAGVAAWIEEDNGREAAVHVDKDCAEQLPTLLRVAEQLRQQPPQVA